MCTGWKYLEHPIIVLDICRRIRELMGETVLVAFSAVCRFLLKSLTDTELKLAYDVHFIQRSFQSAVCSCAAIHLVLMKGISNRSPLSTYRFFHCLQIEQDSLL